MNCLYCWFDKPFLAGDNQDYLESFVPRTYPRKSKDARNNYSAGSLVSVVVGGLATAMVLHTLMVVYRNREQREIKLAVSSADLRFRMK